MKKRKKDIFKRKRDYKRKRTMQHRQLPRPTKTTHHLLLEQRRHPHLITTRPTRTKHIQHLIYAPNVKHARHLLTTSLTKTGVVIRILRNGENGTAFFTGTQKARASKPAAGVQRTEIVHRKNCGGGMTNLAKPSEQMQLPARFTHRAQYHSPPLLPHQAPLAHHHRRPQMQNVPAHHTSSHHKSAHPVIASVNFYANGT